jgi:hypothetical protein
VDHAGFANNCNTCHTGTFTGAVGKGGKHGRGLLTSDNCDACHNNKPTAWNVTKPFNHAETSIVVCGQCHDGTLATGKDAKPNHVVTTARSPPTACRATTASRPAARIDRAANTTPD